MKRQVTVYSALEKRLLLGLARSCGVNTRVLRYTNKSITYSLYGKRVYAVVSMYRAKVGLNWNVIEKVNHYNRNYPK